MEAVVISQPAILSRQDKIDEIIQKLIRQEDHLSFTSLANFARSPVTFIDYKIGKLELDETETAAMKYGKILHCAVLEPQQFDARFFCLDDSAIVDRLKAAGAKNPRAMKEYKQWKEIEAASAGDREIVSPQDAMHVKMVAQNVFHNRAARKILEMCEVKEKGISWEYKNFKFKGYIDGRGAKMFMDLKSMADAEMRKAQRTIADKLQYVQAAAYQIGEGVEGEDHYILAVDKKSGVSAHKLDARLLEQGFKDYDRLVTLFNHCIIQDAFDQSFDFWAENIYRHWDGIFICEHPGYMLRLD
jgi:hypothetical protein